MTTTATLPQLADAVLCADAAWQPVRLMRSSAGALEVPSALAELWWMPRLMGLGGGLSSMPEPARDYLTDSSGLTLTDSDGQPLWASDMPSSAYLTDADGTVLTDSSGIPL